jgi:hypothetical protein
MRLKEINEIAKALVSYSDITSVFPDLFEDYDYFDDVHGYLSEDNALALIKESFGRSEIKQILAQMFYFSNVVTVSETVFTAIMSYSVKEIRRNILIALSHCSISYYQLDIICREKICMEAFAAMLDIYLNEYCFSAVDLSILLRENIEYINTIAWDLILSNKELERKKKDTIQEFLLAYSGR